MICTKLWHEIVVEIYRVNGRNSAKILLHKGLLKILLQKLSQTHVLPINGLDEVIGIISETVFRKIVKESSIVTPETLIGIHLIILV